jgi:hypothetical protein
VVVVAALVVVVVTNVATMDWLTKESWFNPYQGQ